jgi:hypothetical protein
MFVERIRARMLGASVRGDRATLSAAIYRRRIHKRCAFIRPPLDANPQKGGYARCGLPARCARLAPLNAIL